MKRSEAKAAGLRFYDNGKPCPLNHSPSIRYVVTGKCLECTKSESTRYKEKRAAHAAIHSSKIVQRVREWRDANPERTLALQAEYRERHREELRTKNVAYRKTHPVEPLIRVMREGKRRARKAKAGGSYTKDDIQRIRKAQSAKCAYCRKSLKAGYHIDHIIPLVMLGSSNPNNLQLVCHSCNSSKGGKHPIDFARKRGLLL